MVTIEKLLKNGIEIIKKRDFNNPILDVQLILSNLLKKDRVYLHIHKSDVVSEEIVNKFYEMANRRNEGYPLQYMLNSQEFMGLEFYIQDGVLVPRPDTEILVENIIKIVNSKSLNDKNINILDIGTGSGAIAVSLAYYLKNSNVTAFDIDKTALETTNINISKHELTNIKTLEGNIFDFNFNDVKYDIVVSNPPYIERNVIPDLPIEVSVYEPKLALDGGVDGLDYYRRIVEVFDKIHCDNAILSVEIGYDQKHKVMEIFNKLNKFKSVECLKDLGGNDRVVTGFL